jgi:condensin complex subunit 2
MNKCAAGQNQSGVTLPFYFICVLHLANEHGLKLEGNDELTDFTIAMDAC